MNDLSSKKPRKKKPTFTERMSVKGIKRAKDYRDLFIEGKTPDNLGSGGLVEHKITKEMVDKAHQNSELETLDVTQLFIEKNVRNDMSTQPGPELYSLAYSIANEGVVNPPKVIRTEVEGKIKYSILNGHRRFRAVEFIMNEALIPATDETPDLAITDEIRQRVRRISCIVQTNAPEEVARLIEQVLDNDSRVPLDNLEWSDVVFDLSKKGMSQVQIGQRLGKSKTRISEFFKISSIPPAIKRLLREIQLTGYSQNKLKMVYSEQTLFDDTSEELLSDTAESSIRGTFEDADKDKKQDKSSTYGTFANHNKIIIGINTLYKIAQHKQPNLAFWKEFGKYCVAEDAEMIGLDLKSYRERYEKRPTQIELFAKEMSGIYRSMNKALKKLESIKDYESLAAVEAFQGVVGQWNTLRIGMDALMDRVLDEYPDMKDKTPVTSTSNSKVINKITTKTNTGTENQDYDGQFEFQFMGTKHMVRFPKSYGKPTIIIGLLELTAHLLNVNTPVNPMTFTNFLNKNIREGKVDRLMKRVGLSEADEETIDKFAKYLKAGSLPAPLVNNIDEIMKRFNMTVEEVNILINFKNKKYKK